MGDEETGRLGGLLEATFEALQRTMQEYRVKPVVEAVGRVTFVGHGIARVRGLADVRAREVIRFPGNALGMAFNLDPEEVGIVLLDRNEGLSSGAEVRRTGRVLDVPVGEALLGRVVDAVGRPIDGDAPPNTRRRLPIERPAPGIMDRAPVTVPLQTGLKVVDALIPIGRGQRELILGDRQTGKTAIALDAMINQRNNKVICVYCAIGQRMSAVAKLVDDLANYGIRKKTIVVATSEEDPPGLQFVTPYAAMSMGEYFRDRGRDVLLVLDDLTRHAWAYRELSLLLRRPPGREAFPGDIFYIHSRLLERSTHLNDKLGGGSLTTLPIVETEAQNISAYIPTNLISITDGQIYLSPDLFRKGVLPAIEVGRSVSRVGGKTQLTAYRAVAGDLKLTYSQFQELEAFARFGTRLEEHTRKSLERGRRVREVLKQALYEPLTVPQQLAALVAMIHGLFDEVPIHYVSALEAMVRNAVAEELPEVCERIELGRALDENDRRLMIEVAQSVIDANREMLLRNEAGDHRSVPPSI
ncbi:alternate F1F0 ATPase, F1 subunit alpha [Tautonia rosea]|uniref:alternate F1F0 ATPase, F1 subunit alpha n=1 Tax=Tautonia rosea TaxID=2728037 RepID=UPI001473D60F|nr:alternate F1F0 ATPase, F1 subunit alpha [Tautonia rosea]